jgi:cysteinyl-tRNA synthetase
MPSIQDVADQINAKLDNITTHTSNTAANTNAIKTGVNTTNTKLTGIDQKLALIDAHLQDGFVNLSQGIFALTELGKASLVMQEHHRKQNDTIICLLENSNEMLCGITRKLTRQLELSESILIATARIAAIEERVHAGEAADYDRHNDLRDKIELCCPPPKRPPEPCPEACPKSDFTPPRPKGQDWKPLSGPKIPG